MPTDIGRRCRRRADGPLTELVLRAGAAILAVDRAGMRVDGKADGSPVTEADLAADRIIAEGLARLAPEIPALSEERANQWQQAAPEALLPDRSAGRHQGIRRRPQRIHRQPRFGGQGNAAARHHRRAGARVDLARLGRPGGRAACHRTRQRNRAGRCRSAPGRFPSPGQPWIAAVSRSHGDAGTEAFIDARRGAVRQTLGSAVKFAPGRGGRGRHLSAPGADLANGTSPPGMRVVTAAGGKITDAMRRRVALRRAAGDFIVPGFIAWGDPSGGC